MRINDKHIFTLSGELIQGRGNASHEMLLGDNSETIPIGRGFVHGSVSKSARKNQIQHYLGYAINDNIGISDLNFTHMGQKAKPKHYEPALRTLLQHYSQNPKRKFIISLAIGDEEDPSHPVLKRYKRATGREAPSPHEGYVDLTSIDDIKNFIGKGKAEIKRKRLSRDLPAVDTSRLETEPPMAQGNMTTAEWNFWRRKGLGDSYMPIMTFKELINESRLEQLSVQNIGRRSWIGPHGESIDIDRHAGEGDTDYHHLHLVVDKPHLFGFTTDELQTIDPFRHRLLKSKTTRGGRAQNWSNAIISEVGKRGWIRAANDTFKDQNSDDIIHHFNLSHHGYEGEHNLKAFIPALKTVRDTISSTQNSKRDPIHVYLEGYDSSTIRRFHVTLRSIESINSFIKNHADLPKQETKSTHLPIILQQFNSTQTREMLGRNPPEGIPQAVWNNMRTIGDSYMPIMTFKEFINESTLENKIRGTLATAMLSSGMLNAMGIPVEHVPNIVHNYWQQILAPTPEQQLTKLATKYQHLAKKQNGKRVLDIESIPNKDDREQFMKLATGQDNENI